MAATLLGRKVGMTRVYDEAGASVPVTVLAVGPCFVSQVKTTERDGYTAVQVAFDPIKPRRSTMPKIGHDAAAGLGAFRVHREFRVAEADLGAYELGQELTVSNLDGVKFVDVIARSKGKGFQGVMKRWNFKGQPASHGCERKHRSPGSIAAMATNRGWSGKPKKGKGMAGHMGDDRVTVRALNVVGMDKERNLLLVKGPVPGGKGGLVIVRPAVRLWKSKAALAKAG
jgi:large subunit ribosomal protein L3